MRDRLGAACSRRPAVRRSEAAAAPQNPPARPRQPDHSAPVPSRQPAARQHAATGTGGERLPQQRPERLQSALPRRRQPLYPTGVPLLGRNAGDQPPGLSDALACSLQYVWATQGRRILGIDPDIAGDRVTSPSYLPGAGPNRLVAISCSGDRVAVSTAAGGLVVR